MMHNETQTLCRQNNVYTNNYKKWSNNLHDNNKVLFFYIKPIELGL